MRSKHLRVCVSSCKSLMPRKLSRLKRLRSLELPESSGKQLVLRFSEIVRQFSKLQPLCAPEIESRPLHPHRFEYSKVMKEFKLVGQVDQVLRLLKEMKDLNLLPDVVCYTIVVDSLVEANRPEHALAVFEEMICDGLAPDTASCTVLVKLYSFYLKQFDFAYEVIWWMKKWGCSPDTFTYTTLIAGLCWDGRVEEAFGVLDYMLDDECLPNVYTYTPIVNAYCSKGKLSEAKKLVEAMGNTGCFPNTVTYNVLIKALCTIGAFDEVDKVLEESMLKGWKPDEITYSTYMNGLCKWGKIYHAFQQIDIMIGRGLFPNVVTMNILLDCLCSCSMAWDAKFLLERGAELEWDANVVNYNTVMSRLCDDGCYRAVFKLFTDMLKKGISANAWTLSIVINSLCRAGKLRKAKCILDSGGLVSNVVTYTTLIHYFYLAGEVDEVQIVFSEMVNRNITPNFFTYSIMVDCFCRDGNFYQAIDCFLRSLELGLSQELAARLTYWLVTGGKIRLLLDIIEQILERGISMDSAIYCLIIKASCKMGYCQSTELYTVCCILDKMLSIR